MSTSPAITPESFDNLGALLRYLRQRARLSQRELSIAVGYSEAQISRLEQNQRSVDPAVLSARFVPALALEYEPAWVARLLSLAGAAPLPLPVPAPPPPPAPAEAAPLHDPTLLATRLHWPPPRPDLMERPRLLAQLDRALHYPLTLIAAPAGYGKSALLAGWLQGQRAQGRAVGWLALEAEDNDPATLLRYLVGALQGVAPGVGAASLALLSGGPQPTVTALLTPLLHELARWPAPAAALLVLDDVHLLAAVDGQELLRLLVERLPPWLHLVLATRVDPPLPLGRLRGRGQLLELRANVLRFTAAEAAALLGETLGVALSADEVAQLTARTEGWAAGLQLAGLALREREDTAGFVAAFSGSHRFVLDYLAGEVLARLAGHQRRFLLQTAILERFCGALCDAVLGLAGEASGAAYSQVVLEELAQQNLFLVGLDEERCWYRYHHLFAEVLRAHLQAGSTPAQRAELHRRAARWFHQQNLPDEALSHAGQAGDQALLLELATQHINVGLSHSDHRVRRWLAMLPREAIMVDASLALYAVDTYTQLHQLSEALDMLDRAPALNQAAGPPVLLAKCALRRARSYRLLNKNQQARSWIERALAAVPPGEPELRALIALEHGLVSGNEDFELSISILADAAKRCHEHGLHESGLFAEYSLVLRSIRAGRLYEAIAVAGTALEAARQRGETWSNRYALLVISLCEALVEQNRLAEAGQWLEAALPVALGALDLYRVLAGCWIQARIVLARGDASGALACLDQGEQRLLQSGIAASYVHAGVALYRSRLYVLLGDPTAALAATAVLAFDPQAEPQLGDLLDAMSVAAAMLAQARRTNDQAVLDRTRRLLERWCAFAEQIRRFYYVVQFSLWLALFHQALGDEQAALLALQRALELAAPEDMIRLFVEEGRPMADLLHAAVAAAIQPAFCSRLLAAFD